MKKVVLLGATGSIGKTTLELLRQFRDDFVLTAFSYHNNEALAKKIQQEFLHAKIFCTGDDSFENRASHSKKNLIDFLRELDYDIVVNGIVGSAGSEATLTAINMGKRVLLANKESLVMAGELIVEALRKNPNAELLPIDSEHNSVFRLLKIHGEKVQGVTLTASGGPFFGRDLDLSTVTIEQALSHPTWQMGAKISIDSAGLINKALEIIEAHYLFGLPYQKINAVIHPQSYVHAMLELSDGSQIMHGSVADMKIPIAHGLLYPDTAEALLPQTPLPATLNFFEIEKNRYPGFFSGLEAARRGGVFPAIFNAANEVAVQLFLEKKINFLEIPALIEKTLEKNIFEGQALSWSLLQEADSWARRQTMQNNTK